MMQMTTQILISTLDGFFQYGLQIIVQIAESANLKVYKSEIHNA